MLTFTRMKNIGEILASVLKDYSDCCIFLHNTRDRPVAEKIMNDGFVFESQLSHSTDRVNPNEAVEIIYFLFQRKEYGDYTIVIAIPRIIYEEYSEIALREDLSFEEVITISEPHYGDNDELVFTLSPCHVLGYFEMNESLFNKNNLWDPDFNNWSVKSRKNQVDGH